MTKNMLKVMESICMGTGKEGYAHYSTALALERQGLVYVGKIPVGEITESGDFPHYLVKLTTKGEAFCNEQFGKK